MQHFLQNVNSYPDHSVIESKTREGIVIPETALHQQDGNNSAHGGSMPQQWLLLLTNELVSDVALLVGALLKSGWDTIYIGFIGI